MMLWVALAGGVGAVCRFVLDARLQRWRRGSFPLGTFVINVSGSLLLGVLHGVLEPGVALSVVGTGFCGGFTTFSTATVEAVRLRAAVGRRAAVGYVSVTLVMCVFAAWLGLALS